MHARLRAAPCCALAALLSRRGRPPSEGDASVALRAEIAAAVGEANADLVIGSAIYGENQRVLAERLRAKLRDFVEMLHVYPTMAEALKIGAISRYKDPAKLS